MRNLDWRWCSHCEKVQPFQREEYGDYQCLLCGKVHYAPPTAYLDVKGPEPSYEDNYIGNDKCSGYIPFSEVAERLDKSERTLRYDIATSNYPVLTTSIKQDGRCLYREDLVDLTARTGIFIRYIDGVLIIKASEAAKIMGITTKTAINNIKTQRLSGWCSGEHYYADMQNVLDQADRCKPVSSGLLHLNTRRLFQATRDLATSGHPSS